MRYKTIRQRNKKRKVLASILRDLNHKLWEELKSFSSSLTQLGRYRRHYQHGAAGWGDEYVRDIRDIQRIVKNYPKLRQETQK